MDIKLPFGLRDGKLIHISEITESNRGLSCNCICPKCNHRLNARIGNVRIHHFAHKNEECKNSIETALHLFAKEILEKNKKMLLPKYELCYSDKDVELLDFDKDIRFKPHIKPIIKERFITFDKVELEKRIDGIIPDLIGYKNERPLLIEIAVTHFIDVVKLSEIKRQEIATLEIDLSELDYYNFNREEAENIIINGVSNKAWIYNKNIEDAKLPIMEYNKHQFILKERDREQQRLKEISKRKYMQEELNKRVLRIDDRLKHDNAVWLTKKFDMELEKNIEWQKLSKILNIDKANIPPFLNVIVKGHLSFDCDYRLWQSCVFNKFIKNRLGKTIKISNIVLWVQNHSNLPYNKDLLYPINIFNKRINTISDTLIDYFKTLEMYGFIKLESQVRFFYSEYVIVYDKFNPLLNLSEDKIIDLIRKENRMKYRENTKQEVVSTISEVVTTKQTPYSFDNEVNAMSEVAITKHTTLECKTYVDIPIRNYNKSSSCKICGDITSDWTIYYGVEKTCICRKCNIDMKNIK